MYKSLLPQCCVNKGSYYPLHVHVLTVTLLFQKGFLLPLYRYKSLLPQSCVNNGSYHPSTCISPYCYSAVSIMVSTNPLHVQVLTATVLCQYVFSLPLYTYKSLLPQCCVNKGYYYPSKRRSLTLT